jgi:CHAT domain-containing protein
VRALARVTRQVIAPVGLATLLVLACRRHEATAGAGAAPLARPFLPRLSIPTSYRVCRLPAGPAELPGPPHCRDRDRRDLAPPVSSSLAWSSPDLATPVSTDTTRRPLGWSAPHRAALAALIGGRLHEHPDDVMSLFQKAIDHGRSAALLSDLAAAHFVRAQELDQPAALVDGLEAAIEATTLDPRLPAAQFNRGLLCRELGLRTCSEQAWKAYLESDASSPWAREVQGYQRELEASDRRPAEVSKQLGEALAHRDWVLLRHLASLYPATAERWVTEQLLDRWAAAVVDGADRQADELRNDAAKIADGLQRHGHVSGLQRALEPLATSDRWRRSALADGHREYARAMRVFAGPRPLGSRQGFAAAARALARGGSPFASDAELQRVTCLVLESRYAPALAALARIERSPGLAPGVAARAAWLRATTETQLRRPLDAVASYRRASELYAQAGDFSNRVNTDARLAEMLDDVGQGEEAWSIRRRALQGVVGLEDLTRRPFVWGAATDAALAGGWVNVAGLFQDQAVAEARRAGNPLWLAEALRQNASVALEAGRDDDAEAYVQEAWELVRDAPDDRIRQAIVPKLEELQGRAVLARDPDAARSHFDAAIHEIRRIGQPVYLAALHLERAEALQGAARREGLDRGDEVRQALRDAVDLIEQEWESTLEHRLGSDQDRLWPTYFGSRRRPFDRLIRRLYEAGKMEEALDIAEKARAREVLDLLRGPASLQPGVRALFAGPARPLGARELLARLPRRTVLVEYAFAEGRLLTWVLAPEGVRFVGDQPSGEVTAMATALAAALRSQETSPERLREELAAMFDHLVMPFAGSLRPLEQVVVVADGALHGVPFAALYNRAARRYWIEDHPLAAAPSATLYVYAVSRDRELPPEEPARVLAVGDPAFDAAEFPQLPRLGGAAEESTAVAALYPRSRLLGPRQATKEGFLAELGQYSVVHFAGHAIGHPWAAYLVLARGRPGESSALYASELLARPSGRTRLVFLSACSSAGEQAAGGQGVAALVRPLIGAGIPAVVGTLWPVDDPAAIEVAKAFHRHLLSGKDAPAALQAAQIELLHHEQLVLRQPQAWAGFEVVGHASLREAERED